MRQSLVLFIVFVSGLLVGALIRFPPAPPPPEGPPEASTQAPSKAPPASLLEAGLTNPAGETGTPGTDETAPPPERRPPTDGVVLVTGTWGAFEFWPVVVEGKSSFASELIRVMNEPGESPGRQAKLFADASMLTNDHDQRLRNAAGLADVLDDLAQTTDRVHLIAHSHGGNVALAAAGLCQTRIQTLVCLATPHILYDLRDSDYQVHRLPVYLSPRGRANIETLLTISATTDRVVSTFAGLGNGLQPGQANALIAAWESRLGPLRPARGPNPIKDLLGQLPQGDHDPNLITQARLPQADHNLHYQAPPEGPFTTDTHNTAHARAIGALLGPILRDGPLPRHLLAINRLTLTNTHDDGWPQTP